MKEAVTVEFRPLPNVVADAINLAFKGLENGINVSKMNNPTTTTTCSA